MPNFGVKISAKSLTSTIKGRANNKNLFRITRVNPLKEFDYFNAQVRLKGYFREKSQMEPGKIRRKKLTMQRAILTCHHNWW